MTTKRNALGKGLSALLENYDTDVTSKPVSHGEKTNSGEGISAVGNVTKLPLKSIYPNPFQPRTNFDQEALMELAASIEKLGLIQPVTVRKLGYDKYQLISGERRLKAASIAGLPEIPAYIRIANDQEMLELSLVENIQRQDLNALEIAISFQRLTEECKLTQEQLSERIGKNRTTISNYLRLLKLPDQIQAGLRDNKIQMGHARALINIENPDIQIDIFIKTIKRNLSVRQVEELVRNIDKTNGESNKKPSTGNLPSEHKKLAYRLSTHFDTPVEIRQFNNKSGRIVIPFKSDEDLERIMNAIDID